MVNLAGDDVTKDGADLFRPFGDGDMLAINGLKVRYGARKTASACIGMG
ncbi:hypothetical protein [Pseudovibrio sp. SPO723]|nr:hypothetical protein [Pseudovibrio sp. SPO723]MDX5593859.1 hypothetical protein [Pseudovibrio sp. SPO723]